MTMETSGSDHRKDVPTRQLRSLWCSRRVLLFILAVTITLGVTDTFSVYLWSLALHAPLTPDRLFVQLITNLVFWLTLAGLIPPALFLAARARLDVRPRRGPAMLHLSAALGLPVGHLAVFSLLDPMRLRQAEPFAPRFFRALVVFWAIEFLAYWAIVTALYMVQFRRESAWKERRNAELEASLVDARLQSLRAQLNPHFLFNTLNSVSVLALQGQHRAVSDMLERLSNLLRAVLDDRDPHEVPLSKELEFLDAYLQIQKIRFADRMTVSVDVSPDVLGCLVPRLILQPVVENAIVHGIGSQPGPGTIGISAARDGGRLHLVVTDTGPGFSPERRESPAGIGLSNTMARLQQLYGADCRLECVASSAGSRVAIWLPIFTGGAPALSLSTAAALEG